MQIERYKQLKKARGLTLKEISVRSGVPFSTVQKIFSGATSSPRYETLLAIDRALRLPGQGVSEVAEEPVIYGAAARDRKRQGEYTLRDYLSLPDDQRVELIDGVFYDMASPSNAHQNIAGQIYRRLANFIDAHKGACVPFISPSDVQLDSDDRTVVQPDVYVVCDRSKLTYPRTVGAPDLVVEVLSPATRRKDMTLKQMKYEGAGVREYWIVDPDRCKVIVYIFGEEPDVMVCGFDARVPVHIFDGACVIDFNEIWESVAFLYEGRREGKEKAK